MNTKTTIALAVVLVVVVAALWLGRGYELPETAPPDTTTKLLENTPLIAPDFGDPVRIACQRRDGAAWTFERDSAEDETAQPEWNLVEPLQAKATSWQVSGIARRLKQLQYQVKFAGDGSGAVSAGQAGLDPAVCTVRLENENGRGVTVEVGKEFADQQTYVRLDGAGDIYAVSGSLESLLKNKAIEYRDLQLVKFDKKYLKRVEIADRPDEGEPVTCVAVQSDAGWTLEAPAKAVAVKDKLDAVATALSSLAVTGWVEAEADNLAMYGLDKPGLTVRVRVEEPPPKATEEAAEQAAEEGTVQAGEEAAEKGSAKPGQPGAEKPGEEAEERAAEGQGQAEASPPEPVVREFVVNLSRRSPIGDATKVYARLEGDRAVGTVAKTVVDRLTPNLAEWRDMRLTRANVSAADRIELTTPRGQAIFIKRTGKWADERSGGPIDQGAVTELLDQLKNLKAQNFVEAAEVEAESLGFEAPQATIRLNVPGQPEASRFVVGGYTDADRRRLVYVRLNEAGQVAKVRVADVEKVIRDPASYRNRTVFDLKPDRFEKVVISRPDNLTQERFTFALSKVGERLQITEPAPAETSDEQVKKLTTALGAFKATQVMPETDPGAYGLDRPEVTCEITYLPPEMTKLVEVEQEPAQTTSQEAEGPKRKLKPEQYQPPPEDYRLLIASHEGGTYAMREGVPVIYQVPDTVLSLLRDEYHQNAILAFEQSQVTRVAIAQTGAPTHEFAKLNDRWQYLPEPDLPIDPKRVQDLLLRLKDLTSERFVTYNVTDLAAYGLDEPEHSVTVKLDDGTEQRLIVSATVCEADPAERRYAMVAGKGEVFLVSEDTVKRFEIDLKEYEVP